MADPLSESREWFLMIVQILWKFVKVSLLMAFVILHALKVVRYLIARTAIQSISFIRQNQLCDSSTYQRNGPITRPDFVDIYET